MEQIESTPPATPTAAELRKALELRLANYRAVLALAVGSHADACRAKIAMLEREIGVLDAGGPSIQHGP